MSDPAGPPPGLNPLYWGPSPDPWWYDYSNAVDAEPFEDGDRLYVSQWDVFEALHRHLEPHELIRIGADPYEVLAHDVQHRRYWVRPFSLQLSEGDLARLVE